ncbi:28051_t:CDS:2, partial [Racocetra persica]
TSGFSIHQLIKIKISIGAGRISPKIKEGAKISILGPVVGKNVVCSLLEEL